MDKSLFINMSGAKDAMRQLAVITNNLANTNTPAFRADYTYQNEFQVDMHGMQSRSYSKLNNTFTNFDQGPIMSTDRELDIAIQGPGFIAVQSPSGQEQYTREGNLAITKDGTLTTANGNLVMGQKGPIHIPPAERIVIGPDGTVSARLIGAVEYTKLDQIRFVNPDLSQLHKATNGLFDYSGGSLKPDLNVKVIPGALEGSNVSVVDAMTKLIDLSRTYQTHTTFMRTISENALKANSILDVR